MLHFEYLLETEMNPNYLILLDSFRIKLEKAISHLDYSYRNIDSSILQPEKMSEQELANWESLTARFSRVSEIFLQRYLRTWILSRDPGFEGSFRDILNIAHKNGLIDSPDLWFSIREMRNRMAHEYEDSRLQILFEEVLAYSPHLLALKWKLPK